MGPYCEVLFIFDILRNIVSIESLKCNADKSLFFLMGFFFDPQLQRNILASNPRVTRFHINWEATMDKMEDSENVDPAPNTMLPPTSMPGKAPPLGLMPDNSMDCL